MYGASDGQCFVQIVLQGVAMQATQNIPECNDMAWRNDDNLNSQKTTNHFNYRTSFLSTNVSFLILNKALSSYSSYYTNIKLKDLTLKFSNIKKYIHSKQGYFLDLFCFIHSITKLC